MRNKNLPQGAKPITFHMHPYHFDNKGHVITKEIGGSPKRYLAGIASGPRVDAHGDRMTEKCLKSFMDQANSGDMLLYPDLHGVAYSKDIGIMDNASITEDGDWYTEFRLYDQEDFDPTIHQERLSVADTIWKKANGEPPYSTPKQMGFSIEGYVPDDHIIKTDINGTRAIDDVVLDGVVVVPRPAYQDSVIHAVYKALGETPPWVSNPSYSDMFKSMLSRPAAEDAYYERRVQLEDVKDKLIEKAMSSGGDQEILKSILDEYQFHMIDLIMKSESLFTRDSVEETRISRESILKNLESQLHRLSKSIGRS